MPTYSVRFESKAVKALESIPSEQRKNIVKSIDDLAVNPRPSGCKKLKGVAAYRIKIGNYRVIYDINDQTITITVLKVGHRKQIYE